MNTYKIQVLNTTKDGVDNNPELKEQIKKTKKYYLEDAPKAFGVEPIKLIINVIDRPLNMFKYIDWFNPTTNNKGTKYVGLKPTVRDEFDAKVGDGYDAVMVYYKGMWDVLKYFGINSILPRVSSYIKFKTPVIEMPVKLISTNQWKHEILHAIVHTVEVKTKKTFRNQLDETEFEDGSKRKYYKNKYPTYTGGNYDYQFREIIDDISVLAEKPSYKYFSESESYNINPEFMSKLDAMRGELGRPMVITSGYRTEAQNKKIGGAEHSYHLSGNAVDVKILDSKFKYDLVRLAYKYEIYGIEVATKHIHLDMRPEDIRTIFTGISK